MALTYLRINGKSSFVESFEFGGFGLAEYPDIIAQSVAELVNRLRAANHQVVTDPEDDGRIDTWYLCATNPLHPNRKDVWHFLSERKADAGLRHLSAQHPNLVGWHIEKHRLTPEEFRIISSRGFPSEPGS